jgi:hypothetical protein
MQRFKSFINIIGAIGTGQTLWGWISFFPGLGAIVTGILASHEGVPPSVIIFLACGVLCFLSVSIHYTSNWWKDNSVKGKVRLEDFRVAQIWQPRTNDGFAMNCVFLIKNHSMFDLYYRIEDALLILQGRTGEKNINKQIIMLPSGAIGAIQVSTILGINTNDPSSGTATLKLCFGKNDQHLNHNYEVDGLPNISFALDDKGNVVGAPANILFRSVTYT